MELAKSVLFFLIVFILSDFWVVVGKEKFVTLAIASLCFVAAFVGYYFDVNKLSTISYLSQYQSSSVILKSSSGQVMVVGDCYLLDECASRFSVDYNIFVSNQSITSLRYDALENQGFETFICFEEGAFSENYVYEFDQDVAVGNFKMTYLSSDDKLAGVRVNFDNLEIFIASQENLSYNEIRKFDDEYNFDFIFADYYVGDGEFVHISNTYIDGCDYSYNAIGNMAFSESLIFGRLD